MRLMPNQVPIHVPIVARNGHLMIGGLVDKVVTDCPMATAALNWLDSFPADGGPDLVVFDNHLRPSATIEFNPMTLIVSCGCRVMQPHVTHFHKRGTICDFNTR